MTSADSTNPPAVDPNGCESRRGCGREAILLLLILLLAAALRSWGLGAKSVWVDEIATLQLSTSHGAGEIERPLDTIQPAGGDLTSPQSALPWTRLPQALRSDTHPPLYLATLRIWRDLLGPGDVAARGLSLVCSVAAILALYDAVRLLHGSAAALSSALLMAVAGSQIFFAQEMRSYSMLTLLLLLVIAAIVRIEIRGVNLPRLIALGTATFAAAMTHYLAIPAELALGLYILLRLPNPARRRAFAAMALGGAAFMILCGPLLWSQRQNFSTNLRWLAEDEPGFLGGTLSRLARLPIQYFITPTSRSSPLPLGAVGALGYLIPLLALRHRTLLIWAIFGGAIIGTTAVSDLLKHQAGLRELRMTVAAAPAAIALVTAGIMELRQSSKVLYMLSGLLTMCCLASLPNAYSYLWKPDYRMFASAFDRLAGPEDVIVLNFVRREDSWAESIALAGLMHYSSQPKRSILPLSAPATPELLTKLRSVPGVWMLRNYVKIPPDQLVPGAVAAEPSVSQFGAGSAIRLSMTQPGDPISAPTTTSPLR